MNESRGYFCAFCPAGAAPRLMPTRTIWPVLTIVPAEGDWSVTAPAGALSLGASLLTSILRPTSSSSSLATPFNLPTTFGTATVRPRTARYVITPAPKIKTTANSATVSKLWKMLLEPLRESKCVLLIFIRPMQIVSSITFPLQRYGRGKVIEETICMGRAIDWKGSVASLMFGFQWRAQDRGSRIEDRGSNNATRRDPRSSILDPQSSFLTLPRHESSSV